LKNRAKLEATRLLSGETMTGKARNAELERQVVDLKAETQPCIIYWPPSRSVTSRPSGNNETVLGRGRIECLALPIALRSRYVVGRATCRHLKTTFQSTRPREARPMTPLYNRLPSTFQSARPWRARHGHDELDRWLSRVSIHVPARGAKMHNSVNQNHAGTRRNACHHRCGLMTSRRRA
jgi:hypothetical protein